MSSARAHNRTNGVLAVGALGLLIVALGVAWKVLESDPDPPSAVKLSWLQQSASGDIRYCTGEDISHSQQKSVDDFNAHSQGGPQAKLVQTTTTADVAHDEYVGILGQKQQDQCDVVYLDVIYMPEFAEKRLIYDMGPYLRQGDPPRIAAFDAAMAKTVRYDGRLWGVPKQLDAGVLFMRTDMGLRKPTSWNDLFELSRPKRPGELPRLRFQSAGYEGLTVVFLELAYSAGAKPIISDDGKRADIDQEPAIEALEAMRRAIGRSVPEGAINQGDKGSLNVFERGRALYMRSWPFAAARIHNDADTAEEDKAVYAPRRRQVAENFKVLPLPPWRPDGESVGILGGHNLVIASNAHNPRGALQLIDFLTSFDQVSQDARDFAQYPVLERVASDPAVKNETLQAIKATRIVPRPVIANYAEVSRIISDGLNEALKEGYPIRSALAAIEKAVQEKLG